MPHTTSYQIGEHFKAYIGAQVASGRYKSASEVMSDALRMHEEREQGRQRLLEALDRADAQTAEPFDAATFNKEMRQRFPDPT